MLMEFYIIVSSRIRTKQMQSTFKNPTNKSRLSETFYNMENQDY